MTILILLWFFVQTLTSNVVKVQDGDTIELKMVFKDPMAKSRAGKNLRIRLAHVDCPEKGQAFFKNAKQFTINACVGKTVKIIHSYEFDRYGRLIGEVVLPNGKILNEELVKNGLAIHFKKYSSSYNYAKLEIDARVKKIGIWSIPR